MVEVREDGVANGDQFAVTTESFDTLGRLSAEGGSGEVAAMTDLRDGEIVHIDGGEAGQEIGGGNEGVDEAILSGEGFELGNGACLCNFKLSAGGATELIKVRAAAERLAEIVSDGTQVGTAGAVRADPHIRAVDRQHGQFVDLYGDGRQFHRDGFASQFVGAAAGHFLRGYGRRGLEELAAELFQMRVEVGGFQANGALGACGEAGTIIGIGGPAEADCALVDLVAPGVKLGEARGAADDERQHAGGDGIERAEVSDAPRIGDAAHFGHYIVGSPLFRFVDYDDAVQGLRCGDHDYRNKTLTRTIMKFRVPGQYSDMASVGETLRRARLKRNIELNRVADELKISATMLKAIEEEHFEKLPGGVFARSFVRQYARFLEVDEGEIASELNKVLEPPLAAQEPAPTVPAAEIPLPRMPQWQAVGDYGSRVSSSVWALVVMVLVMLGCAGAYAWWQRARHTVTVRVKAPVATEAAQQATPTSRPAPPSAPAPPAPAPAPAVAAAVSASPAEENSTGAQVQVELIAQEPTWVSVRADGEYSFSGTLDANQSRTVSADRNVVLRVGNAAGLEVRLNGKSIGPLGDAGTVRTIQFTSGGFHIVPREAPKPESPTEPAPEAEPNPL